MNIPELNNELVDARRLQEIKSKLLEPTAPEGYYDDLEQSVFAKLKAENLLVKHKEAPRNLGWIWSSWKPYAIAASLVMVATLGTWFVVQSRHQNHSLATSEETISAEDAEIFLLANLDHFEPNQLNLDEKDLPEAYELEELLLQNAPKSILKNASEKPQTSTQIELDLLEGLTDKDLEELL